MKTAVSLKDKINEVLALYSKIPPTKCMKTSCGDWCCTKLEQAKDKSGNFMSLPLIYTIEFEVILDFLTENYTEKEIEDFRYPQKKSPKCVFRTGKGCAIYPVRPFSCRVYGRKVPDVLWGIELPEGVADAVNCPDCVPVDKKEEDRFINRSYMEIWDKLHRLSRGIPIIKNECGKIFKSVTGLDELVILGWIERSCLLRKDIRWFESRFLLWWQSYSRLL
ncbi:hypothetical protein J7L67_09920 [bacterium]|nr:hypothetical protein [bacterium]